MNRKMQYLGITALLGIYFLYKITGMYQTFFQQYCENAAYHAAAAADAFRCLAKNPSDQYERYRAFFHRSSSANYFFSY